MLSLDAKAADHPAITRWVTSTRAVWRGAW